MPILEFELKAQDTRKVQLIDATSVLRVNVSRDDTDKQLADVLQREVDQQVRARWSSDGSDCALRVASMTIGSFCFINDFDEFPEGPTIRIDRYVAELPVQGNVVQVDGVNAQ